MPHDVEWLDDTLAPSAQRICRPVHLCYALGFAVALGVGALLSVASQSAGHPTTLTAPAYPAAQDLRRPLPHSTPGAVWYLRGSAVTVRIELAGGRVTITPLRGLLNSGPVSFIAMPSGALARPVDPLAARRARGAIAPLGAAGSASLVQTGADGAVYDVRPVGERLVLGDDVVLATAARRLTADCDAGSSCLALIVPDLPVAIAVVVQPQAGGGIQLRLVDPQTGLGHAIRG